MQSKTNNNRKNNKRRNQARLSPQEKVQAPVAKSLVVRTQPPKKLFLTNGDCRVVHREYIQDLKGSVNFVALGLPINPGLSTTFPWLCKIARNYESYRFNQLRFCYETEAPTSVPGTSLITVDYDASDAAPLTKTQAMAYRGAVRSAPWNACKHVSKQEDLSKRKSYYVRSVGVPADSDVKLYDTGNAWFCRVGQANSNDVIGELYVEYDVTLMTPEYANTEIMGGTIGGGGSMTAGNPLGTNPSLDPQSNGISFDDLSTVYFAQSGDYLICYSFSGTNITAVPADLEAGPGSSILSQLGNINASGTAALLRVKYRVSNPSLATLSITLSATTVTASRIDVAIAPSNSLN